LASAILCAVIFLWNAAPSPFAASINSAASFSEKVWYSLFERSFAPLTSQRMASERLLLPLIGAGT